MFTVNHSSAAEPQEDLTNSDNQRWKICTPANAQNFSAVGYFFGKELYTNLNIPLGLVCSSWGGSSCETWANQNSLEFVTDFAGNKSWAPEKTDDNQTPTVLYNGMIAPLVPFNFAGVCWYQGETNVGRAKQLTELFPAMIEGWRSDFNKETLPFYFVQLAPWDGYGNNSLPEFWEAQTFALNLHHTEMAATLDAGDKENIHPAKKECIGNRLAKKALANVYGETIVFAGPRFDSLKIENNKIRLFFSHVGSGLKAAHEVLQQFEIAGSNNIFYPAQAEIDGNEVVVWNNGVPSPKNVRYAWSKNAGAELYNNEGFPAAPFRTNPPAWMKPIRAALKCNSELIRQGEEVLLEWTSIGATEITLNNDVVSSTGKIKVTPDSTTTFVLNAGNGENVVSQTTAVYVIPGEIDELGEKEDNHCFFKSPEFHRRIGN